MKFTTTIQTCLLVLTFATAATASSRLSYADHGASWGSLCSAGLNQSPINFDLSTTTNSTAIYFKMMQYQAILNATLSTPLNGTQVQINYPNQVTSDIELVDEIGRTLTYHLSSMNWRVPSEHTINNRQFAAELQIVHSQAATNKQLILSVLFDMELEQMYLKQGKAAKTCFVDSFDFDLYAAAIAGNQSVGTIEVPLKQFLEYIPQTDLLMYYGSQTVPSCQETVTWIVNTKPHIITLQQRNKLFALLANQTKTEQGNYRNIQSLNDRTVYSFNNVDNYAKVLQALSSSAASLISSAATLSLFVLLLIQ